MIILYEKSTGNVLDVLESGHITPCVEHGVLITDDYMGEKKINPEWLASATNKEQQLAEAQEQIYKNHIAEISKKVLELNAEVERLGGKPLAPISPELQSKLSACDDLNSAKLE
jgi:Asp/Glu/hydantoin racemase